MQEFNASKYYTLATSTSHRSVRTNNGHTHQKKASLSSIQYRPPLSDSGPTSLPLTLQHRHYYYGNVQSHYFEHEEEEEEEEEEETVSDLPISKFETISQESDHWRNQSSTDNRKCLTEPCEQVDPRTLVKPSTISPYCTSSLTSHHLDLLRTDSGNSSLNTNIDTFSNASHSSTGSGTGSISNSSHGSEHHFNNNNNLLFDSKTQPLYPATSDPNKNRNLILLKIYIPEIQCEYDIKCARNQSIWRIKVVLIEQSRQQGRPVLQHKQQQQQLQDGGLNHGLFCFQFGRYLDEELALIDYFPPPPSPPPPNSAQQVSSAVSGGHQTINKSASLSSHCPEVVSLEFLYKQRIKFGEVMSTLPLASTTRKRRKRSRLISAIQNGNLDKVAKALANCDPNFVDESTGETPLSLIAACQSSTSTTIQQILVATVNGGALLDFRTKDGRTALHVACQKSNFVALKTLLDLGASPNYVDSTGLTPLYYSIIYKANPKLTQLLLHEHATHGITDQHGWQEVHHSSKLGLVSHLEQLLYYGCDMNCRIVGSGNTPLHVAAINDQAECARILLLRGCDTTIVNNSHQNAHQVAVISGNMSLAELIINHKPEMVVPYRDKPRFNPARRPQTLTRTTNGDRMGAADSSGFLKVDRPSSPSLSQTTNNTTTTSSGVCCDDDEENQKRERNNGNEDEGEEDENDDEDEDDGEYEGKNDDAGTGAQESSESDNSATFLPGMTVKAVSDYNSGDPSHLQLRRNENILLLQSDHSPPTIASQKVLLGRRCADGKEGFFPACCIEKIKRHHHQNGERVEGRRDMKMKCVQSATLPTRGRRGARKCLLEKGASRQYQERTVTLHRGSKGFGFVLRGAKDSSPILSKQFMQQQQQQQQGSGQQQGSNILPLIGLQYFDEIETSGVADAAGLKRADFLLAVNDVDVRHMSHESVVQLIRQSGDKVTMTIATPVPKQLVSILKKKGQRNGSSKSGQSKSESGPIDSMTISSSDVLTSSQSQNQMSQSVYGSFNNSGKGKARPPAPPKRDPSTTLSTSRARARSLVVPSEIRSAHNQTLLIMNMNDTKATDIGAATANADDVDGRCSSPSSIESLALRQGPNSATGGQVVNGNKVASIRSRSSRRISSYELNEFMSLPSEMKTKSEECRESLDQNGINTNASEARQHFVNNRKTTESLESESQELPPPPSPSDIQTSIVKVTLAKPIQTSQQSEYASYANNSASASNSAITSADSKQQQALDAMRSLTSFQPAAATQQDSQINKPSDGSAQPQIPEPDYSSDEDDKQNKKMINGNNMSSPLNSKASLEATPTKQQQHSPDHSAAKKLTTTATVVFKSSSPFRPNETIEQSSEQQANQTSSSNGMFSSKNMFEELREQSAKITGAARLRFSNRQSSQEDSLHSKSGLNRQNSQDDPQQPVSNVMKNVAEFERKLSFGSISKDTLRALEASTGQNIPNGTQTLRMSKSYIEDFVPNNSILKKDFSTLTKSSLRQQQQHGQQDTRRNSAIISAMAEKVAAVNQLVAEQQQQSTNSGSKSLNSSPIPLMLGTKAQHQQTIGVGSAASVVVQKPIAVLPPGSSATLTRRCVTVCEDPVKAIHLQQQHQQLRSQLAAANAQLVRSKHSSLAESTSSILKQTSSSNIIKPLVARANTAANYSQNTEQIVVPPPPEFAVASPGGQITSNLSAATAAHLRGHQSLTPQQKIYVQRQLQAAAAAASTSPLTIQQQQPSGGHVTGSSGGAGHHHHHHQVSENAVTSASSQHPHPFANRKTITEAVYIL